MSLDKAKELLKIEADAINAMSDRLDVSFTEAVSLIADCQGRVVVTGMGKTGIIGRKIASTFSSTGTPSLWMHSAEAVHGDLGQVQPDDVLLILSNSGETQETKRLLPLVKRVNARVIALTGNVNSSLAQYADVVLDVSVEKEGCPLGLAPMASTTATLAMGDALAACLIVRKGFEKEDFAFYHPGGTLGRRLLLKVKDVMRTGDDLPRVLQNVLVKDALLEITRKRCGAACVLDDQNKFIGIFTDGDLRRHLEKGTDFLTLSVKDVMTAQPKTVTAEQLAAEALQILQDRNIDELPVVDDSEQLIGLLDIQDLLKAGLI